MSRAQLTCDYRGERIEVRDGIPLHQCGHFNAPCSTALPVEGVRLCKTCPAKTSGPGKPASKPKMSFAEMAEKRKRCKEAKSAGLPCTEFTA